MIDSLLSNLMLMSQANVHSRARYGNTSDLVVLWAVFSCHMEGSLMAGEGSFSPIPSHNMQPGIAQAFGSRRGDF